MPNHLLSMTIGAFLLFPPTFLNAIDLNPRTTKSHYLFEIKRKENSVRYRYNEDLLGKTNYAIHVKKNKDMLVTCPFPITKITEDEKSPTASAEIAIFFELPERELINKNRPVVLRKSVIRKIVQKWPRNEKEDFGKWSAKITAKKSLRLKTKRGKYQKIGKYRKLYLKYTGEKN